MDDLRLSDFARVMEVTHEAEVGVVRELTTPPLQCLVVDGEGSLGTDDARAAVRDLYALTFAVHLLPRKGPTPLGWHEYDVATMEGIWGSYLRNGRWSILFPQPDFVTESVVESARAHLAERRADDVRLETFPARTWLQTLHVGDFTDEERTVRLIERAAVEGGHELLPHHHEVYLDDPQRVEPARMRTVIRYPVHANQQ